MNKTIKWLVPVTACIAFALGMGVMHIPDLWSKKAPVAIVENNPTGNVERAEIAITPPWDEMLINRQFSTITFNGHEYWTSYYPIIIDAALIGEQIDSTTLNGYDIYEEKQYTINCEVYSVKTISDEWAVAVKYDGHDGYYPFRYINYNYMPATLGDLIDDLNLRENLVFGPIYDNSSMVYTLPDPSVIWDLLLADTSLKLDTSIIDEGGVVLSGVELMGVSIDVEVLGHKNISLSVTADGYLQTNILDTGKAFFIGMDKVQAFIDYVKTNGTAAPLTTEITEPGTMNLE
jgi:hypothetical protein